MQGRKITLASQKKKKKISDGPGHATVIVNKHLDA